MRTAQLLALVLALAPAAAAAQANPFPRESAPLASLFAGRWNGVNLERRSNCAVAQNNGSRGTYAQFDINTAATGEYVMVQTGVTGLNCEYRGRYETVANQLVLEGNYGCSDGKQGTYRSTGILLTANLLHIRFVTQLTGSEACTIEAILSMARHEP